MSAGRIAVFLSVLLAGCAPAPGPDAGQCGDAGAPSSDAGSCRPNEFFYSDRSCGLVPDGGPPVCGETGDLRCHRRCSTAADCTDPCAQYCTKQGLWAEGDYNCNSSVKLCRAIATDDGP